MRHETRLLGAVLILLTSALVGATARAQTTQPTAAGPSAIAVLSPTEGNDLQGTVTFIQTPEGVRVQANITGLTAGTEHGFHVHQYGDCSASDGTSAGGHFNPHGADHAGPDAASRHVGDLGNIQAGPDGVAEGTIIDRLVKLSGPTSVIGRSMMIHADPDDLGRGDNSQPGPPPTNGKSSLVTGNAGARIACGEIKLVLPKL